ncbi:MAG: TAXI family TRAP transporter solute-binding subunit, partial [Pseudomonadota bacterium]
MKRIIYGILIAVFSVALFAGFTSNPATAAEPFEIQFLAGRSDSAEFALTHGLSTLINKHSKWLRAKVIETPGMLANYELVVKKPQMKANSIICGVTSGAQLFPLTKAEGGFSWGPYTDHRFVARMNETIHTFITLDPKIKTIKDLKGKKLAEGRKVATRYLDNEMIFKEAGIFDTLKISHGGTGAGITALRDGLVDA